MLQRGSYGPVSFNYVSSRDEQTFEYVPYDEVYSGICSRTLFQLSFPEEPKTKPFFLGADLKLCFPLDLVRRFGF